MLYYTLFSMSFHTVKNIYEIEVNAFDWSSNMRLNLGKNHHQNQFQIY